MHMLHAWVFLVLIRRQQAAKVGLPQLVAAARQTASELYSIGTQAGCDSLPQLRIRLFEDQSKGIVAAAFDGEVGLINVGIEVVEEQQQVLGSLLYVVLQPRELRAA